MKTIRLSLISLATIFLMSCQTKTAKTNTTGENSQIMEQQNPETGQQLMPFHDAAFEGNLDAVTRHIRNQENPDSTNQDGHTPLMLAAFNGHSDVVKILLENGANVNLTDSKGLAPLHFAASGAYPQTVKLLLEFGAAINATDQIEHFTPLMYAAAEGNTEVVKILIESGADISLTDDDGDNAQAFAAQNNHPDIVKLLQINK